MQAKLFPLHVYVIIIIILLLLLDPKTGTKLDPMYLISILIKVSAWLKGTHSDSTR